MKGDLKNILIPENIKRRQFFEQIISYASLPVGFNLFAGFLGNLFTSCSENPVPPLTPYTENMTLSKIEGGMADMSPPETFWQFYRDDIFSSGEDNIYIYLVGQTTWPNTIIRVALLEKPSKVVPLITLSWIGVEDFIQRGGNFRGLTDSWARYVFKHTTKISQELNLLYSKNIEHFRNSCDSIGLSKSNYHIKMEDSPWSYRYPNHPDEPFPGQLAWKLAAIGWKPSTLKEGKHDFQIDIYIPLNESKLGKFTEGIPNINN